MRDDRSGSGSEVVVGNPRLSALRRTGLRRTRSTWTTDYSSGSGGRRWGRDPAPRVTSPVSSGPTQRYRAKVNPFSNREGNLGRPWTRGVVEVPGVGPDPEAEEGFFIEGEPKETEVETTVKGKH